MCDLHISRVLTGLAPSLLNGCARIPVLYTALLLWMAAGFLDCGLRCGLGRAADVDGWSLEKRV